MIKAVTVFLLLTVICGFVYPTVITGICQVVFPKQANASVIEVDGKKYGSVLLAQQFTENKYMWGRIMNIDTSTYTGDDGEMLMYAAPSNKSPASDEYEEMIKERVAKIQAANPEKNDTPIPSDLVTCSGSGLDPHISVAAAEYQIERIASERNIEVQDIQKVIDQYTTNKFLGVLGEETVNVLQVNLALDGILK